MQRTTYKESIRQQLQHNSERRQRHLQHELLVPHIQGNEGYPPVPEPSQEQVVTRKREVAKTIRRALDQQVAGKKTEAQETSKRDKMMYNRQVALGHEDEVEEREARRAKT